ncbi:MAG: redoxin domain-containing protein [Verrucomicrobia bacterium]|nr:redoxin domain-containing protein [Verrucomicrobiota bacterium]
MKTMQRLTTAVLLLVAISTTADTWTSTAGSTIEAEFVKEKQGLVYLRTADGKIKKIKKSDLSKEDQLKVTRLASPFAAKKAAEAATAPPKAPDAIYKLFGDELRNNRKKKVSVDELSGKIIGIYFSAHWCGPCRKFTPELVEFHEKMTKKGKPFEIVFVSSDSSKSDMYNYVEEMDMPWLMLPYGDDHKKSLSEKFGVRGIPMLVIIDAEGNTITKNGRGEVSSQGAKAFDKWTSATR